MMERAVAQWKQYRSSRDPADLESLLDDDVVFYSPIAYSPLVGKAQTIRHLAVADQPSPGSAPIPAAGPCPTAPNDRLRIVKELVGEDTAVLEFETTAQGRYVNGVDILQCNEAGRIVEVRVMVRPLQAADAIESNGAGNVLPQAPEVDTPMH